MDPTDDDLGPLPPVVADYLPPAGLTRQQPWPPTGRASNRRRWRATAMIVGGVALAAALVAACATATLFGLRSTDRGVAEPTVGPTLPPVTAAPFSGLYKQPVDLCASADFTQLRPLFNRGSGITPDAHTDSDGTAVVSCRVVLGNPEVTGEFVIEAATYADAALASAAFARGQALHPGAAVAGLGAEAYSYPDPARGRVVTTRDFNLAISTSWRPDPGGLEPAELVAALVGMCRSNLLALRFS